MRTRASSGSPFEKPIGFSRATRLNNWIAVSGTAPLNPDGSTAHPGDLYQQTRVCLSIIQTAIEQLHGSLEDVIRTRIFLTNLSNWEEAARAHGEFFGDIRPASSFLGINQLLNDEWLVEIEADCLCTEKTT